LARVSGFIYIDRLVQDPAARNRSCGIHLVIADKSDRKRVLSGGNIAAAEIPHAVALDLPIGAKQAIQ
jgi:hypothetical protein